MKRVAFFQPRMIGLACFAAGMISLSFCWRVMREEKPILTRLERSLLEVRGIRMQTELPADRIPLISDTGISSPLQDLPESLVPLLSQEGDLQTTRLSGGLTRNTLEIRVESLPATDLPVLMRSLQGEETGWWITRVDLHPTGSGLEGQLSVEALDKLSSAE